MEIAGTLLLLVVEMMSILAELTHILRALVAAEIGESTLNVTSSMETLDDVMDRLLDMSKTVQEVVSEAKQGAASD